MKKFNSGSRTYDHNPVFSLDDSKIAFAHHEWETRAWIKTMDPDGNNLQTASAMFRTDYDENLDPVWISSSEISFKVRDDGLYLFDLNSQSNSPELVIEQEMNYLRVSSDRSYYGYYRYG